MSSHYDLKHLPNGHYARVYPHCHQQKEASWSENHVYTFTTHWADDDDDNDDDDNNNNYIAYKGTKFATIMPERLKAA